MSLIEAVRNQERQAVATLRQAAADLNAVATDALDGALAEVKNALEAVRDRLTKADGAVAVLFGTHLPELRDARLALEVSLNGPEPVPQPASEPTPAPEPAAKEWPEAPLPEPEIQVGKPATPDERASVEGVMPTRAQLDEVTATLDAIEAAYDALPDDPQAEAVGTCGPHRKETLDAFSHHFADPHAAHGDPALHPDCVRCNPPADETLNDPEPAFVRDDVARAANGPKAKSKKGRKR